MIHVDHLSAIRENRGIIENSPIENDLLGEMTFGTATFCIITLSTAIKNDTQHYGTGLCRSYQYSKDMVHIDHLSAGRENGGIIENAPVENDLSGEMTFGTVTFSTITLSTAIKSDTQHYGTGLCRSYQYSHDMVHVNHLLAVRENGGVIENAPVENYLLGEMTFGTVTFSTITLSIAIKNDTQHHDTWCSVLFY